MAAYLLTIFSRLPSRPEGRAQWQQPVPSALASPSTLPPTLPPPRIEPRAAALNHYTRGTTPVRLRAVRVVEQGFRFPMSIFPALDFLFGSLRANENHIQPHRPRHPRYH